MSGRTDIYLPTWLRWLLGAITFLGIAILILSVVLGVRAGQQQYEIRSRQHIAIALQDAIDFQAQGDIEKAFSAYRSVLVLDPDNATATQGIQALLDAASNGEIVVAQAQGLASSGQGSENSGLQNQGARDAQNELNQTASASGLTEDEPIEIVSASAAEVALYDDAQRAFQSAEWQTVIDKLIELRNSNPEFRKTEVIELMYTAHFTYATELEARNNVEEAIANYDAAIAVHPNPIGAQVGKELLGQYMEVLSINKSDHWRMIAALEGIHQADRNYRDVSTRLQAAYVDHGDSLVSEENWCLATSQYNKAAQLAVTPGLTSKRNRYQKQCDTEGPSTEPLQRPTPEPIAAAQGNAIQDGDDKSTSSVRSITGSTGSSSAGSASTGGASINDAPETGIRSSEADSAVRLSASEDPVSGPSGGGSARQADDAEPESTSTAVPAPASAATGSILYAAKDPTDGRTRVFRQSVSGGGAAALVEDGSQPAFRSDGTRLIYNNLRSDAIGLTAFDPGSGLRLRFTDFAEDSFPHWSPDGNRVVFASTREGDRRWRIFTVWAEEGGATTNHSFGETPSWHSTQDLIAYRGCDERGNACGLWTMDGNGGSRRPLTAVVDDSHPAWSPDGRSVVFMSGGRDGNVEIYQLATSSGEVTRLTSSPSIDGIPAVSPSSDWVAFLSDRNGSWGIWRIPIAGGSAQLIAPLAGQPGEWQSQTLQWIP